MAPHSPPGGVPPEGNPANPTKPRPPVMIMPASFAAAASAMAGAAAPAAGPDAKAMTPVPRPGAEDRGHTHAIGWPFPSSQLSKASVTPKAVKQTRTRTR